MSQISDFHNPWRDILVSVPASFDGIVFHVEQGGRTSGIRTVLHEYPKRNTPYAEDMGRHAIRLHFSGYLVYRPNNPLYEYTSQRNALYNALEQNEAKMLVHPVFVPNGLRVMCERYTMTETRERGGYTQFEMQFVEAGSVTPSAGNSINQAANLASKAIDTSNQAVQSFNRIISVKG